MASEKTHVIGIDVGTGSARAGVFDVDGRRHANAAVPTETFKPCPDYFEQSTENIWGACRRAVREAMETAGVSPDAIAGVGFDATACSLVALDAEDRPLTVSPSGDAYWNVILWMDHRATEQAARIDRTEHDVLRYTGGRISPEMAPPKLLWLKEHLPRTWKLAARFLDLADYLTYRATGADARSTCTTVCKWTYQAHEGGAGWARDFFACVGLDDLFEGRRQGSEVRPIGQRAGVLTRAAAEDFGLAPGTPVGVGLIDAHAGGLGMLGAALPSQAGASGAAREALERALALIGGTSSCHMAVSREPKFLDGIWGPYYSAMVPGMWLTEGGQSATGSLIDHAIDDAAATPELRRRAEAAGESVYELLNSELARVAQERGLPVAELSRELHVLPYFLGNRSPRADATLRGVVSGLRLDASTAGLAIRYLSTLQAVAYGTRHIIESLNAGGYAIDTVLVCGGGTKNPLWLQEHADITGCTLHLPEEPESVLLGAALLGAVAGGVFPDILAAMKAMGRSSAVVQPNPARREYHGRKYRAFHRMYDHFIELRRIMDTGT